MRKQVVSAGPGIGADEGEMDLFHDIFGTGNNLGWGQECARAALIFLYGLVLVRIAGRRVFGKWSALDIVVSIVVGSSLSRALTGNADLIGTLIATTLLMALHWILAQAAARSARLSHLLEGPAIRIGGPGGEYESALHRNSVSEADLNEALRGSGIENAAEARRITLEPSGKITVLK